MCSDLSEYLQATPVIDFRHPVVTAFVSKWGDGAKTTTDQAVRLYYAVRDQIRYDPYIIDLTVEGLRASATVRAGEITCTASP